MRSISPQYSGDRFVQGWRVCSPFPCPIFRTPCYAYSSHILWLLVCLSLQSHTTECELMSWGSGYSTTTQSMMQLSSKHASCSQLLSSLYHCRSEVLLSDYSVCWSNIWRQMVHMTHMFYTVRACDDTCMYYTLHCTLHITHCTACYVCITVHTGT